MVKLPTFIISKEDVKKLKQEIHKFDKKNDNKSIMVNVPIIPSEHVPKGYMIMDEGDKLVIYYPDGSSVTIDKLSDWSDYIKPKLNPKDKNKGE